MDPPVVSGYRHDDAFEVVLTSDNAPRRIVVHYDDFQVLADRLQMKMHVLPSLPVPPTAATMTQLCAALNAYLEQAMAHDQDVVQEHFLKLTASIPASMSAIDFVLQASPFEEARAP